MKTTTNLSRNGPEDSVHIVHEQDIDVSYTERHHYVLVVPISRSESGLLHIIRLNSNLMVPRSQVDLRKHRSTVQLIHQVIYAWQRIFVLDGQLV